MLLSAHPHLRVGSDEARDAESLLEQRKEVVGALGLKPTPADQERSLREPC